MVCGLCVATQSVWAAGVYRNRRRSLPSTVRHLLRTGWAGHAWTRANFPMGCHCISQLSSFLCTRMQRRLLRETGVEKEVQSQNVDSDDSRTRLGPRPCALTLEREARDEFTTALPTQSWWRTGTEFDVDRLPALAEGKLRGEWMVSLLVHSVVARPTCVSVRCPDRGMRRN